MVDVDKQACRALAERGYHSGLWPESYVTWDFVDKYPRSMEPGYLCNDGLLQVLRAYFPPVWS